MRNQATWFTVFCVLCATSLKSQAELCDVRVPDGGGVYSVGQGVYVGAGIVLTAKHVIRDGQGMPEVKFKSGGQVHATEWAQSRHYDLAGLLVVAPDGAKPSVMAGEWPTCEVRTVRGQGAVRRGRMNEGGREILNWMAPSVQGDSGGPVRGTDGLVYSVVSATNGRDSYGPDPRELVWFVQKWQGVQCGPDGCFVPGVVQTAYGDDIPPAPRVKPKPATPKPTPKQSYTVGELADAVAARVAKQVGSKGPQGSKGDPGPQGSKGDPGVMDAETVDRLTQQIAANRAMIEVLQLQQSQLDEQLEGLLNVTFQVEVVSPSGQIQNGEVSPNTGDGLLHLDFSTKEF